MSEQVNAPAAENTNQAAADISKIAGQEPAVATAAVIPDSAPGTVVDTPKAEVKIEAIVYDLKKADGSPLDPASAEKIASFAKEQGLSNAQAQKIYDRENAAVTAFNTDQENQFNERKSKWIDTIKSDKEIGGDNFTKTANDASAVIKKYASPELQSMLDTTGLGNFPELVRFIARIAKTMEPDSFVHGGTQSSEKKSAVDVLYDNTNKVGA